MCCAGPRGRSGSKLTSVTSAKVAAYGAILPLVAAQRPPDAAIKWLAPSCNRK